VGALTDGTQDQWHSKFHSCFDVSFVLFYMFQIFFLVVDKTEILFFFITVTPLHSDVIFTLMEPLPSPPTHMRTQTHLNSAPNIHPLQAGKMCVVSFFHWIPMKGSVSQRENAPKHP